MAAFSSRANLEQTVISAEPIYRGQSGQPVVVPYLSGPAASSEASSIREALRARERNRFPSLAQGCHSRAYHQRQQLLRFFDNNEATPSACHEPNAFVESKEDNRQAEPLLPLRGDASIWLAKQ